MIQQNWFALEITVNSDAAEAVEFALNELDALGTEINHLGKIKTETLQIAGYFNEKIGDEIVREKLYEALRIYNFSPDALEKFSWQKVENQDWLAEWKKHWQPTEIDKFIISPTWEKPASSDKIVIYIDPNMAFGTGTHATTQLCLHAIGEHYEPLMNFLDVGTGTGILTIAAVKMFVQSSKSEVRSQKTGNQNPKSFLACDTDIDSIKIARENAELNDVGEEINFYVGSIDAATPAFDFVCANLTIDVILPILPLLIEKSARFLILSGILKEQENIIVEELKKFEIVNPQIETLGEWISVTVRVNPVQM